MRLQLWSGDAAKLSLPTCISSMCDMQGARSTAFTTISASETTEHLSGLFNTLASMLTGSVSQPDSCGLSCGMAACQQMPCSA